MIKRPLPMSIPLPSDFSSASSSSTSPLSISSKNPQHRFDAASFLHSNFYDNPNNKSTVTQNSVNENSEQNSSSTTTNSYSTFQDFATSLATQTAV
jgi:hypothetical protein